MKLRDAYAKLDKVQIDNSIISEIEALYKTTLPSELKKIISLNKDGVSYDDKSVFKGLSSDEILNAYDNLYVDFVDLNLVPLFDISDSEYIVFDLKKRCYAIFDISDNDEYSEEADLLKIVH